MEKSISWLALVPDAGRCGSKEGHATLGAVLPPGALSPPFDADPGDFALACFLVLLHRHSNQSSIAVGLWSDARGLEPLSAEFEDDTAFSALLAALPSARGGPLSEAELASVPVLYCFSRGGEPGAPELPSKRGDVSLSARLSAEGLGLSLSYDASSFREDRMREFFDQYLLLLRAASADPASPVLDYSLISTAAREFLPDPSHPMEVPPYPLMTEAFAAVAAERPGAEAVRQAGRSWSYAETDAASAEIARRLLALGAGPGAVVAVTGPRSFGTVVSILAAFRSGAVLLTVDPKLPPERRAAVMEQAKARFLVAVGDAEEPAWKVEATLRVDPLSGAAGGSATHGSRVELPVLDPGAPAYVFFTSGSTGKPKGVLGCHRGLAHFLDWQRKTFHIGPGDRAAQITALSFDMVLRDMFLALTSGATLSIPAESEVLDPAAILAWMAAERVSVLHVVPTLLRAWLNHAPAGLELPALRRIFLAGEPLTDKLILAWREAFGNGALITNFYGPTETTLIKFYHPIQEVEPGGQPVGRPQPQTQAIVLNRRGKQCGVGEIGQIGIRTPFRTLGYLDNQEATAAVFLPNHFRPGAGAEDPPDLIYMTGDSGLIRPDGLLVMRGRIDNQVKIRGVRVEPGEIEAQIGHCPGVAAAAVVAHANEVGDKYLAAYLVFRAAEGGGPAATVASVRDFLRARLPENMVPAAFIVMEDLPLLPNGKVDRKALKPPERSASASGSDLEGEDAPRDAKEAELLEVWRSVLGHDRIGVNDSFIELGGDSLTAISALVRMQRLGIPNSYARGIFQGMTIRQIAQLSGGGAGSSTGARPLSHKEKANLLVNDLRGILVLVVVAGHWFGGLLSRLPGSMEGLYHSFSPLFAIATPGYALIFGLSLGFIYYPKYLLEPRSAVKALRLGFWLILAGLLVGAAVGIFIMALGGQLKTSTDVFNAFYGALTYYLLANLTAPLWFRLVAGRKRPYAVILGLAAAALLSFTLGQWLLPSNQMGVVELLCLMGGTGKFNYFNMSVGALTGMAAGLWFHRWSAGNKPLGRVAGRLAGLGSLLAAAGLALLLGRFLLLGSHGAGSFVKELLGRDWSAGAALPSASALFSALGDESVLSLWKWVFHGGILFLLAAALASLAGAYERLPAPLRVILNLFGVLGQISLPVFVFHELVLDIKKLLVYAGLPDALALVLPVLAFLGFCAWSMRSLYQMYYGSLDGASKEKR